MNKLMNKKRKYTNYKYYDKIKKNSIIKRSSTFFLSILPESELFD